MPEKLPDVEEWLADLVQDPTPLDNATRLLYECRHRRAEAEANERMLDESIQKLCEAEKNLAAAHDRIAELEEGVLLIKRMLLRPDLQAHTDALEFIHRPVGTKKS
jgi:hypothetical protein